jgi:histidinol-phosphate/aromatic aminotransferase/cobyric acid decarboxylase-like protein
MNLIRKDWTVPNHNYDDINLSHNVPYDKILNTKISDLLKNVGYINNYPNEYLVYKSISEYYGIELCNLSIGLGASDLIERCLKSLSYNKVYIVVPTFEFVSIICRANNIEFETIEFNQLSQTVDKNSILYVSSPNNIDGQKYDLKGFTDNFKYCIIDEVYAEYDNAFSLLNKTPNNVVILKSLSKSIGLAGLRVGFCKANNEITLSLQNHRPSYVTTTLASYIVPKIIDMTPDVITRMLESKAYLESTFSCVPSSANYVLFHQPNKYTDRFGYRLVNGLYRMALADMETLNAR